MEKTILEVEKLCFSFSKDKQLLNNISFKINEGELCLIVGANGSGKSLLLKCLKGLLKPTSATILVNGEDVSKKSKKRRTLFGLVFQDADSQIVGQTVEKDLRFGMENLNIQESEQIKRIDEVSILLTLKDLLKSRPRILSGGEKRRLAIAGILVMKPQIIFMDEPFANLDYPGVLQVLKSLLLLKESGHTIIIVSHEIEKIAAHADRLLLIEKGYLIANDIPELLLDKLPKHGVFVPTTQGKSVPIEEMTWLKH
ncbi:MAG: ABC transporter ATP-binding protein [Spirochaetaceae bacterium]|nr:ABC transporter ATP-binding protein [Spirochaetaceae bacterium]